IDGFEREAFAENSGGLVYAASKQLDLLDAFAEFGEVARDGTRAQRVARGENVQMNPVAEIELELFSVLIGRDGGQTRRAVCGPNSAEILTIDGQPDGCLREMGGVEDKLLREFGVREPGGCCSASEDNSQPENLSGSAFPPGRVRI